MYTATYTYTLDLSFVIGSSSVCTPNLRYHSSRATSTQPHVAMARHNGPTRAQQRRALLRTAPPPATLRQMGGLARWWRAAPRAAAAIAPARRESTRRAARRAARPAGPMRVSRRGCRCRNTYHTRIHTCDTPCVLAAGGGDLGGCMGGDGEWARVVL